MPVQLSETPVGTPVVAVVVSAKQEAFLYSVMAAGTVNTGLAVSCTVKLCVSVMLLPQLSVTV